MKDNLAKQFKQTNKEIRDMKRDISQTKNDITQIKNAVLTSGTKKDTQIISMQNEIEEMKKMA